MKWNIEEEVLLVDLYFNIKNSSVVNIDQEIEHLSFVLNKRADNLGLEKDDKFRNITGIKMKLQNLAYIDSDGQVGLSAYSALDQEVMNMYNNHYSKFKEILDKVKSTSIELQSNTTASSLNKLTDKSNSYFNKFNLSIEDCPKIKLDTFVLSCRTFNCFNKENIFTIKDLLSYSDEELLSIENFGAKCEAEVKEKILNENVLSDLFNRIEPSMLDHFTEEEIKKFPKIILENIENIFLGDFGFLNGHVVLDEERLNINKIKEAVEMIDENLRLEIYFNSASVVPLTKMFYKYWVDNDRRKNKISKISGLISNILKDRQDTALINYVKAFPCNEELLCFVTEHKLEDIRVKDLISIAESFVDKHIIYSRFISLLNWMTFDINEVVSTFFLKLFKKRHVSKIISCRSQNKTLESIGSVLGLTRERVRQIEAKAQKNFEHWHNTQYNIVLMISAIHNGDKVLTLAEISSEINEYSEELIYLLKKSESKDFIYDINLDVCIINPKETLGKAETFVNALPNEFTDDKYNKYIADAIDRKISNKLVKKIINEQFKHTGITYHRNRLTLTSIYNRVLSKYFLEGMKVFEEDDLNYLKQKIYEDFGDIELPKTSRAISARISDLGLLRDRGVYISKKEKYISDELANEIHDYIDNSPRSIFLTNTLFSVFENKLTSEGIDNKYYLQGILRELFGNEFVYKRDYILKDNNEASFYSEIVNYIRKQRYPISQKEIVGEFPGITDIIVSFAVSDPEIINLFGKYIHISSLNISNEYKSVLFASIKDLLCDKKTHHAKELFDTINLQRPDIWRNLFIEFPFGAFSLFEALFGDEFEFKRPYVARKGVTIEHAYERLAEYVNSKEIVEVAEIMDFARENNLLVYSILDLLDSLNDSHLIIDKENISKIDYIGVREDTANILEGHILYELGENDMMPISLFSSTHKLPELDIEWTEWLLYSVIKKWGKEIEVTVTSNQFRSASPVAVRRGKLNEVNIESFVNNDSMTLKKVDDLSNIDELIEDVIEIDLG